jgi:hypothetical protein
VHMASIRPLVRRIFCSPPRACLDSIPRCGDPRNVILHRMLRNHPARRRASRASAAADCRRSFDVRARTSNILRRPSLAPSGVDVTFEMLAGRREARSLQMPLRGRLNAGFEGDALRGAGLTSDHHGVGRSQRAREVSGVVQQNVDAGQLALQPPGQEVNRERGGDSRRGSDR